MNQPQAIPSPFPLTITIFGGTGFVGRHLVQRLSKTGAVIILVTRAEERVKYLRPLGTVGQIVPMVVSLQDRVGLRQAMAGAEVVINLLGTLSPRRGAMERLHHQTAQAIAEVAQEQRVKRLVHISALGARADAHSLYSRSKFAGEQAVRRAFPTATILRPSLVFGAESPFCRQMVMMARWLRIVPLVAPEARLQPVFVGDLAEAIAVASGSEIARGLTYEIGGAEVMTLHNFSTRILASQSGKPACIVTIPQPVARYLAMMLERLPGAPLTRDQILMLEDSTPVHGKSLKLNDLGITAQSLG
ncbi:MAG: complex I NDUFA9 subunit family protein [Alphaproteobacteria bacterium]|nr:complex I NDUFA9 subunit family protein [Alphaproteobacteria bacterium]